MDLLKQRIIDDGIIVSTEIVKVDSFLNHQIDSSMILSYFLFHCNLLFFLSCYRHNNNKFHFQIYHMNIY